MQRELVLLTRNPGKWWSPWMHALREQGIIARINLLIVDSDSSDGTNFFAGDALSSKLIKISARTFNHGGTRNFALNQVSTEAHGNEIIFMTQDALLAAPHSLETLVAAFDDPQVACVYGRQLPHADATPIAAHARIFNYPEVSHVVTLADKERLGIKTCFLSNSFAAYRLTDLLAVGGFPSDVILGEDMAVAARLLMAGKAVAYRADACVYHSHNYTVMQEFRRYFDTGVFHAANPWLLQAFGGAGGEGLRFVRSELRYLWRHAPHWIPSAFLRSAMKWVGYRLGRLHALWPRWLNRQCSMHKGYWRQGQSTP